jgi:hypothetical protein
LMLEVFIARFLFAELRHVREFFGVGAGSL